MLRSTPPAVRPPLLLVLLPPPLLRDELLVLPPLFFFPLDFVDAAIQIPPAACTAKDRPEYRACGRS
jgi:hypothetical protein